MQFDRAMKGISRRLVVGGAAAMPLIASTNALRAPKPGWQGHSAAILGDSITAAQENWFGQVCDRLGMNLRVRAAYPGRRMVDSLLGSNNASALTAAEFSGVDLTLLFLGTNDAFDKTPVGKIDNSTNTATFIGQTKHTVETVMSWRGAQRFIICSPLYRDDGVDIARYRRALEAVSELYTLPYFDLAERAGFSARNASWSLRDALHPSEEGYQRLLVPAVVELLHQVPPLG